MVWLNRASGILLLGFSLLILVSSIKLGIGTFRAPGPGFMGFLASVLLLSLTTSIFLKDLLGDSRREGEVRFEREGLPRQLSLAASLCAFAIFFESLGFLISSFFLVWGMLLIGNPRNWIRHILVALLISNGSYVLLCKLLRVVLPAGVFHIRW